MALQAETSSGFLLNDEVVPDLVLCPEVEKTSGFELSDVISGCVEAQNTTGDAFQLDPQGSFGDAEADSKDWQPGVNVGSYIWRRVAPLQEQSQVLIANVALSLGKLPTKFCRTIAELLPKMSEGAKPFSVRAAACLMRLPAETIREVLRKVRGAGWNPIKPSDRDVCGNQKDLETMPSNCVPQALQPRKSSSDVMRALVREALYTASYGLPQRTFTDSLCRLALNGCDTGDKYGSRDFLETVETLSSKLIELQESEAILLRMPALGVPSPMSIVFDGATLGGGLFSKHETFEVVIANFVGGTGSLENQLIGTPSPGLATDGHGLAATVLRSLEPHEAVLNLDALRCRLLSLVGGDGAVIGGGPSARHSSSKAGEKLYATVHPDSAAMVEWDQFHRLNSAWGNAVSQSSTAQELLAVAKAMSQHFGHGHGKIIYRSVAEELGEKVLQVDSVGGTRPLVTACRASANLLRNFKVYGASFHANIQRRQVGKGSQSQGSLSAIGRRLTS